MKLVEARVQRLPGIDHSFDVEGFGPAATLVVGPNGIGKSSFCRLVRLALWPDRKALVGTLAKLVFEQDGTRWEAEIADGHVAWRRDGEPAAPPPVPDARAARATRLGLVELVRAEEAEQDLEEAVRRELAGGYDLAALREARTVLPKRPGKKESRELSEAERCVEKAEQEQRELAQEENRRAQVEREMEEAARAHDEEKRLEKLLELAQARSERRELELRRKGFPDVLERLHGDERKSLDGIDDEVRQKEVRIEALRPQLEEVETRLAQRSGDLSTEERDALRRVCEDARRAFDARQTTSGGDAERAAADVALEELRAVWPEGVPPPPADLEPWLAPEATIEFLTPAREGLAEARRPGATAKGRVVLAAVGAILVVAGLALPALLDSWLPRTFCGVAGAILLLWLALHRRGWIQPDGAEIAEVSQRFESAASHLQQALGNVHKQTAQAREVAGRAQREFEELRQAFVRAGLSAPEDLAHAEAALKAQNERAEERAGLERQAKDLRGQLDGIEAELQRLHERREKVLAPFGEQAEQELDGWLRQLDDYRELRDNLRLARGAEERTIQALGAEAPGEDDALDEVQLERQRDDARRKAGEYLELTKECASIKAKLEEASRSSGLSEALEKRDAARAALRHAREATLHSRLAGVVVDFIDKRHARESAPALVRRTARRLTDFTRGRYELELDTKGLRARDTATNRVLDPAQLSDGTRIQLFLASRWSYLESLEGELHLPVMLDEALATSDPERFAAIAGTLLDVAGEERQVLYFGAREEEVGRWNAVAEERGRVLPACVDLAAARGLPAVVRDPEALRVPKTELPAPDGLSPEEYGARLGVPLPDPFADPGSLHVFHLLRDRLDLLHRLLAEARVERLGQWKALRARDLPVPLDAGDASALDARAQIARIVLERWRIGRGRPLDEATLRDAEAVSARFRERVVSLAGSLRWDARALVEELDAKTDDRAKGFREIALEKLRDELEEGGFLPAQDPESPAELLAHAREVAADALDAGCVSEAELRGLVDALCATLAAGMERLRSCASRGIAAASEITPGTRPDEASPSGSR